MNINQIIITISLTAGLLSSSCVIVQAIHNNGRSEHVGVMTVEDIEASVQDKEEADAIIAELRERADIEEEYSSFNEYYNSTSDLNGRIAQSRANLKSSLDELKSSSQSCIGRIDEAAAVASASQRKMQIEILENEQCFADLQTALESCEKNRNDVESAVSDYNMQRAKEAEQQRKQQEQQRNRQNSSARSSGGSSNSGNNVPKVGNVPKGGNAPKGGHAPKGGNVPKADNVPKVYRETTDDQGNGGVGYDSFAEND